jgi:hypothetical protein
MTTIAELWREYQELGQWIDAAGDDVPQVAVDQATARQIRIYEQIAAARPGTLEGIAIQARVLADWLREPRNRALAEAVADQLEALAEKVAEPAELWRF